MGLKYPNHWQLKLVPESPDPSNIDVVCTEVAGFVPTVAGIAVAKKLTSSAKYPE